MSILLTSATFVMRELVRGAVQGLLGHTDEPATRTDTHVRNRAGLGGAGPPDRLEEGNGEVTGRRGRVGPAQRGSRSGEAREETWQVPMAALLLRHRTFRTLLMRRAQQKGGPAGVAILGADGEVFQAGDLAELVAELHGGSLPAALAGRRTPARLFKT